MKYKNIEEIKGLLLISRTKVLTASRLLIEINAAVDLERLDDKIADVYVAQNEALNMIDSLELQEPKKTTE